jgi:hypothetical protein
MSNLIELVYQSLVHLLNKIEKDGSAKRMKPEGIGPVDELPTERKAKKKAKLSSNPRE